ncbi:Kinetochore protein Spc24 [Malassezia japonica]|uniref:Kinetochore protein Spc24 n=1 Tax=Malassezia japonica TaxID=223818 RepID=A0AAF0F5R2_9BASI|nr:Kinetochore protein Spc24 [Malassezia japonica]WFD41072.1 Kinetochore protein Spc24 [Malassezia japonica]
MDGSYAERYKDIKRQLQAEQSASESEEESDVTEDEDGEQLTPQVDAAILRTLQKIRSKDPEVYNSETRVFDQSRAAAGAEDAPQGQKRSKKVTLQDYQRQRLQDAMAEADPAKAYADATSKPKEAAQGELTRDEEQEAIRNEFLEAAQGDDDDDLFQVRRDDGEDTYRSTLLGAVGDEDQVRGLLRDDQNTISKENEDFLLNYVLNRGWVDQGKEEKRDWDAEAADLDSEASFDSAADAFEHAYNFRFEDPSLAQQNFAIQSFPRQATDTVRRSDDRRKEKRAERAERKKAEKEEKMRKLDQEKSKKRKSIAEMLKQLREASGSDNRMDDGAFENLDLDADFDPAAHDKMMQSQFGDAYYGEEGEKPAIDFDDDDFQEILDENEEPKKHRKVTGESMDADFEQGADARLSKEEKKRLKKKEKKARAKAEREPEIEMDAEAAPVSETDRKAKARELMDEYYNLGYEDMIGDIPTRFKYASVPKEDYGLSAVEILMADDAELNNVVGLKQMQPYRRNASKPANLGKRLKRFREDLDAKHEPEAEPPKKKRLGKQQRQRLKEKEAS